MDRPTNHDRYDVIVAGARCAGASTAMLLGRAGLRVLVVDPTRRGCDTLFTHALMRCAVQQLFRWGVLEPVREAGTPPIRTTTNLAERVWAGGGPEKLRAFAGVPGFLRQSAGPGWTLVGDAGYFRDPITAHGITDALREAELLARAVLEGTDEAVERYARSRYERVRGFLEVTDRIAAFDWTLEEAREHHLILSKEMKRLADSQADFDAAPARVA